MRMRYCLLVNEAFFSVWPQHLEIIKSKPLDRFGEMVYAVHIRYNDSIKLPNDALCERAGCWWHEIFNKDGEGGSNTDVKNTWRPIVARRYGLFRWICDEIGASTERNVCAVLGDICEVEFKDPIQLFNSFWESEQRRSKKNGV